jgi:alkanesulfonate monooxygenase SsuD/methylene tetrahydromethanopterin reductase-like flavin-dependent oxidoreductase (luciferase family)
VTLRIAAKHAGHWNIWGGPEILVGKSRILEEHCAAVGRASRAILCSANLVPLLTDDRQEVERLLPTVRQRMCRTEEDARDMWLAGSVAEVRDKLARLRQVGVGLVFVPTMFLPADPRPQLDRFITEIAPAFRQ